MRDGRAAVAVWRVGRREDGGRQKGGEREIWAKDVGW